MAACLPPGTGAARLMLFVGGPTTIGPGKVVEKDLQEPIRSHKVCACMRPCFSLPKYVDSVLPGCFSGSQGPQQLPRNAVRNPALSAFNMIVKR